MTVILEMHNIRNYEGFSWVDNSLPYHDQNEGCGEALFEQIAAKHQNISKYLETDVDTPERERVTQQDARKCTAALRLYLMQEGALESCADFVQLQTMKGTRQGTCDQFFLRH
jgi:hypothetical protein